MLKIQVTFNIDSNGILEVTAEDTKSHTKSNIQITNEKGRLTQAQIEQMLEEADKYKDEDELSRNEILAREQLTVYMNRTRKALADIDEDKIRPRDRELLEKKLEDTETWVDMRGSKSSVEECTEKQAELEAAMHAIMLRINRTETDFWEKQVSLPPGEKTVEQGGFFLESGFDLRELIEDVD